MCVRVKREGGDLDIAVFNLFDNLLHLNLLDHFNLDITVLDLLHLLDYLRHREMKDERGRERVCVYGEKHRCVFV
jgi:hypothetical protein